LHALFGNRIDLIKIVDVLGCQPVRAISP